MQPINAAPCLWLVLVAGSLATSRLFAQGTQPNLPWRLTTVDSAGSVVSNTSLAFGPDGQPAIAFDHVGSGLGHGHLGFARFDGVTWSASVIDPEDDAGRNPSLAFGPDGQPAIASQLWDGFVRFARLTGQTWSISTVDGTTYWEWDEADPSLAFGPDGHPAIAYRDIFNFDLSLARFNGTAWSFVTIDAWADAGWRSSLAFGPDGQPAISSVRSIDGWATTELRFARFNGVTWSAVTVDSVSYTGRTSLAIGPDGRPVIAYEDGTSGDLRVARYDGTSWMITTVDTGTASSLAFGPDGQPAIAYIGPDGLRLARFSGSTWDVSTIDPLGNYGTSLAFGPDGLPAISYVQSTGFSSGKLRFAQRYIPPPAPSELVGPVGSGAANYVRGDVPLEYRLNFENVATAPAPVRIAAIRIPLPNQLDLSSVEFASFGFGSVTVTVPSETQRVEKTVYMSIAGVEYGVAINLSLDAASRELRARIEFNPSGAGEWDYGVVSPGGFLPPEDGTGRGKGHIAYRVRPTAGLSHGTEIRTTGFVTFEPDAGGTTFPTDLSVRTDPNSPPDPKHQALVTIDADLPSSTVAPLAASIAARSFAVSWTGTDPSSGVAGFDIYVRTDGGVWTAWLANTMETSALWTAAFGHSYEFVSVARDGVGNVEGGVTAVTAPDVQTSVPGAPGRLLNLSTRALCGVGPDVTIAGFVISGTANKRLLIRAVGPTLADFDVFGVLANPEMTLWERITEVYSEDRAVNDNWSTNFNQNEIMSATRSLGAFELASSSEDAAMLVDLAPGQYTVVARGVADTRGMVLVEIYDADDTLNTTQALGAAGAGSELVNLSTRGYCGTGEQVLIPGFVVSPEGAQTLLVRVVGPTLGNFGVAGVMADPKLTIYTNKTVVAENDDWSDSPGADATAAVAERVLAFPLAAGSADAALVVTLPPGTYTVVCGSADGIGTGVVLAEVFLVQ